MERDSLIDASKKLVYGPLIQQRKQPMDIQYRRGDVLQTECAIIVHGCNAAGAFNAGIARQIRHRFPFAYLVYQQAYQQGLRLGDLIWAISTVPEPRLIGHAITQESYGSQGRYVDYDAIRLAVQRLDTFVNWAQAEVQIAALPDLKTVAMPMIGAGLGGGEWGKIAAIIEAESRHFQPLVYHLHERP